MRAVLLAAALLGAGCLDTTGNRLVGFKAQASGDPAAGAVKGQPLSFTSGRGYDVTLTTAKLFVGAVYLSTLEPMTASGSVDAPCVTPGLTTGEVRGGLEVNLLDPTPQPFPVDGVGTDLPTRSAQLWLTSGDVNADDDAQVILQVEGTATRSGASWPFVGRLTLGKNRALPPKSAALPSANPICEQRIVTPIPFSTALDGRALWLKVDPRAYFASVNFGTLQQVSDSPPAYAFRNDAATAEQADNALFNGLRAASGPYKLELVP